MQCLLFLLIVPSFVLFGLQGYTACGKGRAVAKVDGHEITAGDWDSAHKQRGGPPAPADAHLDAKLLDSPEARYGTLERWCATG
jgi:peptidyl-prolyl cis-trans isomerase D